MMDHLKKFWAMYGTIVVAVVSFLTPSVNQAIATHPSLAVSVGAIWAIILHLLPSPVAPAKPS